MARIPWSVSFLTYNFANAMASRRAGVSTLMFSWERYIPFLPWTILPYWSSDLLYAVSLFVCTTRDELDRQGKRLLAIQAVAVASFLAFPLRCAFVRPPWMAGRAVSSPRCCSSTVRSIRRRRCTLGSP